MTEDSRARALREARRLYFEIHGQEPTDHMADVEELDTIAQAIADAVREERERWKRGPMGERNIGDTSRTSSSGDPNAQ